MNLSYILTPFFAWAFSATLKLIINSIKTGNLAFKLSGYGGLPSNHSSIVTGITTFIGIHDGIGTPAFGIAAAIASIVMLDACRLRHEVGKHAAALNQLNLKGDGFPLRERMGHTRLEVAAGMGVGVLTGWLMHLTHDCWTFTGL